MRSVQKTIAEVVDLGPPPLLPGDATVADAVALMQAQHLACVLVGDADRLAGIFTERDFLDRIVAERRPTTSRLDAVMTTDPQTLEPDDCVTWVIHLMAVNGFRNVPIVDAEGHPVGLCSVRDVTDHLTEVFEELDAPEAEERPALDDWVDIGGG